MLESGEDVGTITTLVMASVRGGKRQSFIIQLSEGRLTNWIIGLTNAAPNCEDIPSIHRWSTISAVPQIFSLRMANSSQSNEEWTHIDYQ